MEYHRKKNATFCIAARISDTNVLQNVLKVQADLTASNAEVKFGLVDATKFHVRLFALYLHTKENLLRVIKIMKTCTELLSDQIKLNFAGLDHFEDFRIIWMKCKNDADTMNLDEIS